MKNLILAAVLVVVAAAGSRAAEAGTMGAGAPLAIASMVAPSGGDALDRIFEMVLGLFGGSSGSHGSEAHAKLGGIYTAYDPCVPATPYEHCNAWGDCYCSQYP